MPGTWEKNFANAWRGSFIKTAIWSQETKEKGPLASVAGSRFLTCNCAMFSVTHKMELSDKLVISKQRHCQDQRSTYFLKDTLVKMDSILRNGSRVMDGPSI